MHIQFFLAALALAGNVQADGSGSTPEGKPMAWRYGLLQAAQASFDKQAATRAPGAALLFRLPKVDPGQDGNQVEIVQENGRISLPMVASATFSLPGNARADADAMVVVNRYFPKGEFNHPNVAVRSPGLPEGARRLGDLRLACVVQVAMAKAEGLKFRALLATASPFRLDICEDLEVNSIDTPIASYDSIMIEDGERRLVQSKEDKKLPQLGDKQWSDNARISYLLNGQVVN